jgi:hypothetical protein
MPFTVEQTFGPWAVGMQSESPGINYRTIVLSSGTPTPTPTTPAYTLLWPYDTLSGTTTGGTPLPTLQLVPPLVQGSNAAFLRANGVNSNPTITQTGGVTDRPPLSNPGR